MTKIQRLLLWLAVTILPMPATCDTVAGFTGLQNDVVFSDYSPLSSSAELLHRLLSPLNAVQARTTLAAREWLRLVRRIFATPMRAISARDSSLGGTGSRLPARTCVHSPE